MAHHPVRARRRHRRTHDRGIVAKYPRHRVMLALAVALTLGNTLTLLAPTFELVAASRVLAGLPHGAYFGIGALVAADVMGPGNRAKGVAFVLTGSRSPTWWACRWAPSSDSASGGGSRSSSSPSSSRSPR
jgi:MFS family permease